MDINMILVVVCGGVIALVLWSTQSKIKGLRKDIKQLQVEKVEETAVDFFAKDVNKRIELLAKDIMELQSKQGSLCRDINYSEATGLSMVTDVYNKVFEIKKLTKKAKKKK